MTRPCEIDDCGFFARPNRRTCNSHRGVLTTPEPVYDETEVDFVVRHRASAAGLERAEKSSVVTQLAAERVPAGQIARLVGVSTRTIHRWQAQPNQEGEAA